MKTPSAPTGGGDHTRSPLREGAHSNPGEKFDFDEQVMLVAIETLARSALNFPWTRGV
jgi:metal-dependent amidase/aminoacylase/carboxypeptidase family protein